MARPDDWLQRVNSPLTDSELEAIRKCAQRGQPFGGQNWIEQLVQRLGLPPPSDQGADHESLRAQLMRPDPIYF